MRIAIFGGSFDPVHSEHLRLAESAIKELGLDKLVVMLAGTPPHKKWKILSEDSARLELCKIAFAGLAKAEVSDYEIAKGGTSYTYLTCRDFKKRYKNAELFWLVGTDMLRDFPTWKNPEEILSYATLAVCGRNEKEGWIEEEQAEFSRRFHKKFVYLRYEGKDVSSTKLRVLAGAGMRLTESTTPDVAEYIEKTGLYKIPNADRALSLEKPSRLAHSLRVAELAAARAYKLKIPERQAIAAALFHDCAKNLSADSPYLEGFLPPKAWGEVPAAVLHQFAGAFVAERWFKVEDEDILNAVRYHTSGRAGMSDLEKLIFLADMLEEERSYEGVDLLRALFWTDLDECLKTALFETIKFIESKGEAVYPLTREAYAFYADIKKEKEYGRGNE